VQQEHTVEFILLLEVVELELLENMLLVQVVVEMVELVLEVEEIAETLGHVRRKNAVA